MTRRPVGIRSLAVSFPSVVRRNDYYRERHADLIANADKKSLARAFSTAQASSNKDEADPWAEEMKPYLKDPFRGAAERRILGPDESSWTLEASAAQAAVAAAKLSPEDIDLMTVSSVFPEHPGPGN